jgi:predicted nucleic acid-binding protein
MIVDANVLVSAVLGSAVRLREAKARGLQLLVPEAQLSETVRVLVRILGADLEAARAAVDAVAGRLTVLNMESLALFETQASARLEVRGKPDWPVLAAALMLDAHIWTNDRDLFGVGSPVWSTYNIQFAQE